MERGVSDDPKVAAAEGVKPSSSLQWGDQRVSHRLEGTGVPCYRRRRNDDTDVKGLNFVWV